MLEEGVDEYWTAKHIAADNLLGMRRGSHVALPSNREIRAAIVERSALQGDGRTERLRHLREVALEVMGVLAAFDPRLIGSVASGAIHGSSDIDLHVFCAHHDRLEQTLWLAGYDFERAEVDVVKEGECRRYVHYRFAHRGAPVELSVYAPHERWVEQRSSIDGKPIDRVPAGRVAALLRATAAAR